MHPDTEETDAALEGTASHELAAVMVRSMARAMTGFPERDKTVGQCAENGWEWDDESYDGALMYAETVREVMIRTGVFNPSIEQRVSIDRIHPESWGTPDCALWDSKNATLYVYDYKYGHKVVEAFENWQLIEYTTGILDELTAGNGLVDQTIKVVMTIVQPRAFHRSGPVRSWTVTASDLRGYVNQLIDVEAAALGDDPTTCTGGECSDCSARHACDTHGQAAMGALHYLGQPTPAPLDADSLAIELRMMRDAFVLIKARKSGLEAQAEGLIASGETVKGYALEAGQGRQRWTVSAEEVFGMGDLVGIELRKTAPITPKQALTAGIDASVISGYSETPSTALKLVESTKTTAHAVFSKR